MTLVRSRREPHFLSQDDRKALVVIESVSKTFGDKVALRDISFDVPKGQICGLLGPNGAGRRHCSDC